MSTVSKTLFSRHCLEDTASEDDSEFRAVFGEPGYLHLRNSVPNGPVSACRCSEEGGETDLEPSRLPSFFASGGLLLLEAGQQAAPPCSPTGGSRHVQVHFPQRDTIRGGCSCVLLLIQQRLDPVGNERARLGRASATAARPGVRTAQREVLEGRVVRV